MFFIAKIALDGNIIWASRAGGSGDDKGYAIATLDDGSSIITGDFFDTATFGNTTLTADASGDIFIARLDANGDFVWATKAAGTGYGYGSAVSGYTDEGFIITGGFKGSTSFGDITLTSASSTSYDVFIAQLRSDGTYNWANRIGSSSHDVGADVVSLDDGGALVSGYFHNTVDIGGTTLTSAGNQDIYIAKVNSDGTYAWVTQAGSSTHDFSGGIASFSDGSGIVTGSFTGTATFGEFTLTSQGSSDIYIAKLDDLGNFLWVQQAGGTEGDGGDRIITHSDGSATIVGHFRGTADFGPYQLNSSGDIDGFVAVIDADGNWVSALSTDESANYDSSLEASSSSPPVFQSASTSEDGTRIILSYNKQLSYDTASDSAFNVDVDGNSIDITSVSAYGSDVQLTLGTTIKATQTVTLDYTDPAADFDDTFAIQDDINATDADSLSGILVTNNSTIDGTPPSVVGLGFPWPHVRGTVGLSAPGFDVAVTDVESAITLLEVTFVSPDGADEVTVDIDTTRPSHGTKNNPSSNPTYRMSWLVPESDPPGSIQGGWWSIKSIRVKDTFENEGIYTKEEFPDHTKNAGFWLNNQPIGKQSIVGIKEIGQTLTINPDTIADPDIDNLPVGTFTPTYNYRWQISDDGTDGWQDIGSQASYTLTELDVNKYFRSIVSYKGKDGIFTETLESDPFKLTEFADVNVEENFESGSEGWVLVKPAGDLPVDTTPRGTLGELARGDTVQKNFALPSGGAKITFDYLKFATWDPGHDDNFIVYINDQEVLSYEPSHRSESVVIGESSGEFEWSIVSSIIDNHRHNTKYTVDVELPDYLSDFTVRIVTNTNENRANEWGEIDNFKVVLNDVPVSGQVAAPIFSSLPAATTVEKAGSGAVVYQAAADDQSRITYSLDGAETNLFSIDPSTGAVRLLDEADFSKRQEYNFTVRATDVFGNSSLQDVNLGVEDSSVGFWKDGGYRVDAAALKDAGPSGQALVLKDRNNRVLSDRLSRSWNGVNVIKSNDGYRMLQVGERGRRRGQYRIAELNGDGVLHSVGGWRNKDQAVADGYEELFELDLNNDGRAGVPTLIDVDADGFVDGLGHYRLMANGSSIDLKDQRGRVLSSRSSRLWNAVDAKPKPEDPSSGFEVLLEGVRGRRRNRYQVLSHRCQCPCDRKD